jgi:hypothetical protein
VPTYNLTMRSSREYPGGLVLANGKPFFGLLVPVVEETYERDSVTLRFERLPGPGLCGLLGGLWRRRGSHGLPGVAIPCGHGPRSTAIWPGGRETESPAGREEHMTTRQDRTAADIGALLRARNTLLWVVSREELRVERALIGVAGGLQMETRFWDCADGITDGTGATIDRPRSSPAPPR